MRVSMKKTPCGAPSLIRPAPSLTQKDRPSTRVTEAPTRAAGTAEFQEAVMWSACPARRWAFAGPHAGRGWGYAGEESAPEASRSWSWEQRMRVGLLSPPWVPVPPPAYGGLEAVVDRLARGLVHAGHQVLLAAPANSACPVPRAEGMDEVDPDAPISGDTITELAHITRAYAAMTGMDVIHDHTIAGPLYRHRPAIPVVTTNHGPFEPGPRLLFQRMQDDTAIVAISHHQASTA